MQSGLVFTASPWFLALCLLVGALYAWLLYQPRSAWSRKVNYLLAAVRTGTVALICFLLLAPLIRTVQVSVDKAKVVLAIDNSASMAKLATPDLLDQVKELRNELEGEGYELSLQALSGTANTLDSLSFDGKTTDLSRLFSTISSNFEGQNLTDVILLSDGNINQGSSPVYGLHPFRIHTVAVGDTIPGRDVQIKKIQANRVAFLGNKFPIQADIVAHGMQGARTAVTLRQGNRIVDTQQLIIGEEDFFQTLTFTTSSDQKGVQHYTIEIGNTDRETILQNNRREVYIDIIDGREKILLLGLTPHPDLKALRTIIQRNENYELDLHVLSAGTVPPEVFTKPYDLIILHQLPDNYGIGTDVLNRLLPKGTPLFFILGNQSSITSFNPINQTVQITTTPYQFDKVSSRYNTGFQLLNLDAGKLALLEKLPPLSSPYGEYRNAAGTEVVLYQKLGNLNTTKPLLALHVDGERKTGVLLGEGLWQWRQEEFSLTGNNEVTDPLFEKIIQLLSIKEDKRRFRVYPLASEFDEGEIVVFQTEVYNDIYERLYGQEVSLKITDEAGKVQTYTYQHTAENPQFELSGLTEGVYRYTAGTVLKAMEEVVSGQFVIRNRDLEMQHTTADFGLLKELSVKTGGQFLYPDSLRELAQHLAGNRVPDRLDSTEELVSLIHLKWLFFLLVALAAIEWGTRKYLGGY